MEYCCLFFFSCRCDWFTSPTSTTIPTTITTTTTTTSATSSATISTTTVSTDSPLTVKLKSIYALAVQSEVFVGTYEEWLETVRGPQGLPGDNGKSVEMQVSGGFIQWRQEGDADWTNLIALLTLTGEPGLDGDRLFFVFPVVFSNGNTSTTPNGRISSRLPR
ncbi:MAG: hypothetical protein MZU97_25810 [Bacillus subtilis]|nr:hypothetical protein [Bacillus subtilis]